MLKPRKQGRGPLAAFFRWFNKVFGRATDGYVTVCDHGIRKAGLSFVILLALSLAAGWFGGKIPTSFLPDEDQGFVYAGIQLPDASSLQRTSEAAKEAENIMLKVPGVAQVSTVVGYNMLSGVNSTFNAFFFVTFKPWSERKTKEESYDVIKAQYQQGPLESNFGYRLFISASGHSRCGRVRRSDFHLAGSIGKGRRIPRPKNLQTFLAAARKRPELASVMTTALFGVPQVGITVDKAKVLTQQVNLGNVYQTLQAFMGGALVNYFNRFGRQWQVYVQADGEYRTDANNLGKFYVKNATGEMVPLSTVTGIEPRSGPGFTMRFNQFQSVQLNASTAPGYSSGQAIAALEDTFKQTMSSEMGFDYMGMSYQEKKASQGVSPGTVFAIAFFIVFLIMAAQYESWTLPLAVLLGTPIAVFGAFMALYFRHLENDVYAQIGLVMLIGLAAKNAILIVEFAKMEYDKGKPLVEASLTGAKLRLRPILMTAFAFILGCVPLWVASGAGGISRQVLGTVVIGGMLAASLLAIFFIPVSFVVIERFGHLDRPQ